MKRKFWLQYFIIFIGSIVLLPCIISQISKANETQKANEITIGCDFIPKNGSDDHNLTWGSCMGLYAISNVGNQDNNTKIKWNVESTLGSEVTVSISEYKTSKGYDAVKIYAPFGYCDTLSVTAYLESDNSILEKYELNIIDGTNWNGKHFFQFYSGKTDGFTVKGTEPEFFEEWDVQSQTYTISFPENSYQVDKLEFLHWKDEKGNIYQPGEKLTVSYTGEAFYPIYAVWGKNVNYTLTYDTQGGYFSGASKKAYKKGASVTITTEEPARDKYKFKEWNTTVDGSGESYYPNDSLTLNNNVILYAIWEIDTSDRTKHPISNYAPSIKLTSKTSKLNISWEFVGEVAGYCVEVSSASTGNKYKVMNTMEDVSYISYMDSALKNGKKAKVRVRAYTIVDGKKIYSRYSNVKSDTLLKKAILKSVTYKKQKKQVIIKWSKPANINGIEIYQKIGAGKYKKIYTAKSNSQKTTRSLVKVKKGKKVSYKIRYYTKNGGKKIYSPFSGVKSVKKSS
ncbi:MAG: InlB B-repeat-containing protein [Lachnospiraceae bacterium]|nr:InlB B-repeat-containing protein [Lachnospiraceae bacterium]